jgi:deoxyribodipyrimidine photo-lyase
LDDETLSPWQMGGASRWWLHQSLAALQKTIAERGGTLILRRGRGEAVMAALARETGAKAVFWNRRYEPQGQAADARLKSLLKEAGIEARSFNAGLLVEPWAIKTGSGGPFKVFSPFAKAVRAAGITGFSGPAPQRLRPLEGLASDTLASWYLEPTKPDWAAGLRATWQPGEAGAHARLTGFLAKTLRGYATTRNRMDLDTTSKLSPHLHWGEISPWTVWQSAHDTAAQDQTLAKDIEIFGNELLWREFSHHLLAAAPNLPDANWKPTFDQFPWSNGEGPEVAAWRAGRTGYPLVDAAMRELWTTGFMHNRARMVAASFLIKHLLVDWRIGEAWFWDTLVDADLANNAASWQWVAGSGADASPFFRIFNPVSQGETYDPEGRYVRRWVKELAHLPDQFIHNPSKAPALVLGEAGVELGRTYPLPIVDHSFARNRALAAFQSLKAAA